MSQAEKQTIAIHIYPNISISKTNQTRKLGQLIKYNMTKNFIEKSHSKYSRKLFPHCFLKIKNLVSL